MFMTREDLMEKMNIPQNTPELVIIRANYKGTGFLRNTYDERYLKSRITQEEFLKTVDFASDIMKKLYSKKRNADAMKQGLKSKLCYGGAIIFLVLYMMMATFAPDIEDSLPYDIIQFSALVLSMLLIGYITIFNFLKSGHMFMSFEEMVKRKLDVTFEKFNRNEMGIEWYVVPGHYWLEVRISKLKKKNERPLFNEENLPIAAKPFLDVSRLNQSKISNMAMTQNVKRKDPMYNNMVRDESEKPYIFSNPLSSVRNDL